MRAAASSGRALQATAATIALCLSVPLLLLGPVHALADTMGYALFGYEPAQCGVRTDSVQTINGDKIRVCQQEGPVTQAFVPGDEDRAAAFFYLGLPGQGTEPNDGLEFSCCSSGENASGRYVPFVGNAFGPVTGSDPLTGTTTFTAAYAGHTYATVQQTNAVPLGSASYLATFAVTNVSGAPMLLRPFAEADGFGRNADVPTFTADTGAGTYRIASPLLGGSVTLSSSTAAGSPAIAHYQAGSGQSLYIRPGHDLDDTTHAPDGYESMSGSGLAVQWADHTSAPLADGATAHYSVRVAIEQPRSLHLALHPGSQVAPGSATLIDAQARGFTPPAGTALVWRTYGGSAQNAAGTVPLDAGGLATVSVPAFTGGRTFTAYVDRNGNAQRDDDEPEQYASLWLPRGGGGGEAPTQDPPPSGGGAPAPPAAAPVVQPGPVPAAPAITPAAPAPPAPAVGGSSKAKVAQLTKGLAVAIARLKPGSAATLTAKLKTRTVGSAKGKAGAKGTVTLKLKLTSRAARGLRGKTLTLRYALVSSAGARVTVTKQLKVV